MNRLDIEKYVDRKVSIVLKNNYKYTTKLPSVINDVFIITDKFGHRVSIDCNMVYLITEVD